MGAPIYIPSGGGGGFTPPTSVSVKTTSYTVPAGKYAKITAYYEGTEIQTATGANLTLNNRTITLNGSIIFLPPVYGFSLNDIFTAGGYTVTFPRVCRFSARGIAFSISTGAPIPASVTNIEGVSSNLLTDNTAQGFITGMIFGDMGEKRELFAKEGDVISGTGNWRALVEEYTI